MKSARHAHVSSQSAILALFIIFVFTADGRSVPPSSGSRPSTPAHRRLSTTILGHEQKMADAWQRQDVAAADRLLADDYKSIPLSGPGLRKADILEEVARSEATKTEVLEAEVRVVSSDVAIYTARIVDYGSTDGSAHPFKLTTRVVDIWVLRHGKWRVVADQTIYLKGVLDENEPESRGVPI